MILSKKLEKKLQKFQKKILIYFSETKKRRTAEIPKKKKSPKSKSPGRTLSKGSQKRRPNPIKTLVLVGLSK